MDPHLPSNPNSHELNSGGSPWNCGEPEEEDEDWNMEESNGEEDLREPKNEDEVFDDDEEEYVKEDEEEEDDDGLDDYAERQKRLVGHPLDHGSSQTDTSGDGEDGRDYYMQNEDGMYGDRINGQVDVEGEEEFEYPNEENRDPSEQEGMKGEEEQGEESGYNDNASEPPGFEQDEVKDEENLVLTNPKTSGRATQKRKSLAAMGAFGGDTVIKKPKRKNTNVWTKSTSRKWSKKNRANGNPAAEDTAFITPVPRLPDKVDDTPDMKICLSKIHKAEKIELSEDRLTAGSTKGYRMVRATRGVVEGAWYFEIKVAYLGDSGHTRLGWSTEKGDVQAPVGYDGNSYAYRDLDGSKVHKAIREPYGDGPYVDGDVIGFYINLPNGSEYAPKPPRYVWYRGQLHSCNGVEEAPKVVPGSEISFFINGICQGVAFKDINAGRYYPAASIYTLPNQHNCTVQFNFGPEFDCFPEDFGNRPLPKAMYEVPYCGIDGQTLHHEEPLVENGQSSEKKA